MKKYLVLVKGRNFRLPFLEPRKTVTKITGFFTTRYAFFTVAARVGPV